jgi:ubiquinone/menaquinone biosynthesis C-methylase UbiE
MSELESTGERFLPGMSNDVKLEHMHRYSFASDFVRNMRVLDIASGEGYGSAKMAENAVNVIGVDISEEAVEFAKEKYSRENLEYRVGSCSDLPVESSSVDTVVSFETIEHHPDHEEMMLEIKRILTSDGQLVISSPDRFEYSDNRGYQNPYHVKELYVEEFRSLLKRHFKNVAIYGQRVQVVSVLGNLDSEDDKCVGNYYGGQPSMSGVFRPMYIVAVASDAEPKELPSGVYEFIDQDTDLDYVSKLFFREDQLDNADAQINYRDDLIVALKKQLDDVESNSQEQISYRDLLVLDLEQKIVAINKNAEDQISYRDLLAQELGQKIIDKDDEVGRYINQVKYIEALLLKVQENNRRLISNPLRAIKRKFFR